MSKFEEWEKGVCERGETANRVFCTHADVRMAFLAGQRAGLEEAVEIAESKKMKEAQPTMAEYVRNKTIKEVIKAIRAKI
jgi:hypothetical protein